MDTLSVSIMLDDTPDVTTAVDLAEELLAAAGVRGARLDLDGIRLDVVATAEAAYHVNQILDMDRFEVRFDCFDPAIAAALADQARQRSRPVHAWEGD